MLTAEQRAAIDGLLRNYDERTSGPSHWTSSADVAWKRAAYEQLRALLDVLESRTQEPRPIDTAPTGVELVLYFPANKRHMLGPMWKVDVHPVSSPRKPTHWAPLPVDPSPPSPGTQG